VTVIDRINASQPLGAEPVAGKHLQQAMLVSPYFSPKFVC
jgi:hypothetical protein